MSYPFPNVYEDQKPWLCHYSRPTNAGGSQVSSFPPGWGEVNLVAYGLQQGHGFGSSCGMIRQRRQP